MKREYEEFINNILAVRGRHGCGEEYCETHHIIPRCIGGTDDEENLIDLYAREHFKAHRLLALENPDNNSLRYAWWMMSHSTKRDYQNRYELTPEEYEEARKNFSELHRQYRASEETRKKISGNHADISGENNPFYGKRHLEETKKKIRESRKGKYEGANNPRAKPVICIETKEVYAAASIASKATGANRSKICDCCNGERKTAGGYQWRFIYDTNRKNGIFIPGALTIGLITEQEVKEKLNII